MAVATTAGIPPALFTGRVCGLDGSLGAFGLYGVHPGESGMVFQAETLCPKIKGPARLRYLRDEVANRLDLWQPSLVVMESYMHGNGFTNNTFQMGELHGVLKVMLFEEGYPVLWVAPTQVKKFILGKGNASKALVMKAIDKRFGIDLDDDNQADAAALALIGQAWLAPWDLTSPQREVLTGIREHMEKFHPEYIPSDGPSPNLRTVRF